MSSSSKDGRSHVVRVAAADADISAAEVEYPDDEGMRVSHETIHQSLYVQGGGALHKELWRNHVANLTMSPVVTTA
jgi:hypothetical protein